MRGRLGDGSYGFFGLWGLRMTEKRRGPVLFTPSVTFGDSSPVKGELCWWARRRPFLP